jgi:hypothetical protein
VAVWEEFFQPRAARQGHTGRRADTTASGTKVARAHCAK